MSKLSTYLKQEGFLATIKKIGSAFSKKSSTTTFLHCKNLVPCSNRSAVITKVLDSSNIAQFNRIKFFSHIDGNCYIGSNNQLILLAYLNDVLAGYIAAEWSRCKEIHGLGNFKLNNSEAWVGPVYVCRKYRGLGISSYLIGEIAKHLNDEFCIQTFYTCINSTNYSSLHSFKKNGYKVIGSITVIDSSYSESFIAEEIGRFERR